MSMFQFTSTDLNGLTKAQRAVYRSLQITGPVTHDELVEAKHDLPIAEYANEGISRRRRELAEKGLVMYVGDQVGPNGWPRMIWAVRP